MVNYDALEPSNIKLFRHCLKSIISAEAPLARDVGYYPKSEQMESSSSRWMNCIG